MGGDQEGGRREEGRGDHRAEHRDGKGSSKFQGLRMSRLAIVLRLT